MRTLLIGLTGLFAGLTLPRIDPGSEPPLLIDVRIDGKTHRLTEGQQATIRIGEADRQVRATVHPYRRFQAAGIEFDYPRGMPFEHEGDEQSGYQSWTLDGNDLTLMVFQFAGGSPDQIAAATLKATAGELDIFATEVERITLMIGGRPEPAHHCRYAIAGTVFDAKAIGIEADGKPCVIMLQDSIGENGKASAEAQAVLQLLDKTLRIAVK